MAVADVNGDGEPDLLVADSSDVGGNYENGIVGAPLGDGDGTFLTEPHRISAEKRACGKHRYRFPRCR